MTNLKGTDGSNHGNDFKSRTKEMEKRIAKHMLGVKKHYEKVVILCVGSDRSTGDSLGPLVGQFLSNGKIMSKICGVSVCGNFEIPLIATNINSVMNDIDIDTSLVVVVDASLDKKEKVGLLQVGGPVKLGAGIGKKDLPAVGDISITGIVNTRGFNDFSMLQNAQLGMVFIMAEIIAAGLISAFAKIQKRNKSILRMGAEEDIASFEEAAATVAFGKSQGKKGNKKKVSEV